MSASERTCFRCFSNVASRSGMAMFLNLESVPNSKIVACDIWSPDKMTFRFPYPLTSILIETSKIEQVFEWKNFVVMTKIARSPSVEVMDER